MASPSLNLVAGELRACARACMAIAEPLDRVEAVRALAAAHARHELTLDVDAAGVDVVPAHPARLRFVDPGRVPQRRPGNREGHGALLHAVAHIECTAMHLALDAVQRFAGLPAAWYGDWLQVAVEEAGHYALLDAHLGSLGFAYGDHPVHDAMWQTALRTAHDPLVRMAIVPRGLEARGLDVTPGMIARLAGIGDRRGAGILEVILRDEIGHVATGSRWFAHLAHARGLDAEAAFESIYAEHLGTLRVVAPHREARIAAGFSAREVEWLALHVALQRG